MGENALFIKKPMFANHEIRYMQKRLGKLGYKLSAQNEMDVICVSGEMNFLYFGDTKIFEFEQEVVE